MRKIDVVPTAVYWSDSGDKVALVTEKTFYVLQYNKELVTAVLDAGAPCRVGFLFSFFWVLFSCVCRRDAVARGHRRCV